jgi:probable phosphoglycerate mutase
MELVLVRHAQPEWVRDGVLDALDPALSELGHRQAQAAASVLAAEHFDEVWVSPLARARQTAAPYHAATGTQVQVAPWLEELRDPQWHGMPPDAADAAYAELTGRHPADQWEGIAGGESIRDFTDRVRTAATAFLLERGVTRVDHELPSWDVADPGRTVLLVAHAGTHAVLIAQMLGLSPTPWEWDRFVLGHASITRLRAVPVHRGHTFGLIALSNVEHLPVDARTR